MIYLQVLLIFGVPFLLMEIQKRKKWFKAIVMAYALGVGFGNFLPGFFMSALLNEVTGISIILAIPLMLFPSKIKDWLTQPKTLLLAYGLATIATTFTVIVAWFVFKDRFTEIAIISGMVEGVYTGGTVNLNAIGLAFNAPNSLSVLLNSYDMAFSAIYLLAIFSVLPKVLSYVLPKSKHRKGFVDKEDNSFTLLKPKQKGIAIGKGLLVAGVVLAAVVTGSVIFTGEMNELIIVFGVSLCAMALSFVPAIRSLPSNMVIADYLMMVFGFSLGAQASISELMSEQSGLLGYFLFTYVVMLCIHLLLAKIFKIDVDTFIISSTAAVFGPPFIGPVAESLKNRSLIGPGIVIALMGNAIGTYLGILIVQVLQGIP
ncbi:MAG: putative membrane protein [Salibacteraceae bacterium]|jgi:uncharacterized membrane protein